MRWMRCCVLPPAILLILACGDPPVVPDDSHDPDPVGNDRPTAPVVRFADPVDATLNDVQFYGAYVDLLTGSGLRDYECRSKTYDGHLGTDMLLRNFVVMDSGVTVVAAADGRVVEARDGLFDRSVQNGSGGFGNHVVIDHGSNVRTIYGHLRLNSLQVSGDDQVSAGQALGLIGSSGNSTWLHLHFEVQVGGTPVDPFTGACSSVASRWETQLEYQDTVMVTDADISDLQSWNLGALLERPEVVDTFTTADPSLTLWVQILNLPSTAVRIDLYAPDGTLFDTVGDTFGGTFSIWYVLLQVDVAGVLSDEGDWRLDYYQGGAKMLSRTFTLVAAHAAAAPARPTDRPVGVLRGFGVAVEG